MLSNLDDIKEIERIIKTVDPSVRLWDFSIPGLLRKRREFDFSSENFTISIIDPFKGVIPSVMCHETLAGHDPPLLAPTVILDSNVMARLHQFVTTPEKLAAKYKKVIVQLLDYLLLEKVDYNPAFYYLESFSRAADADHKIIEYTKSILVLHMMDELHFLQKREIRTNKATLEKYVQKFGTSDVDEMAKLQCKYLKDGFVPGTDWKVMYLIILKAALIHKTTNSGFQSKMNELNDFIYSIFGVLFSRELSIAAFYFSGKLDKFVPLQKGSNFQRVIDKLRATAWDMYLLRFPELFLGHESTPVPLAVVCTGDKSVQYIGRKFRVRKLFTSENDNIPALEIDFSDISDSSSQSENTIEAIADKYSKEREKRRKIFGVDEVLDGLDNIIAELEINVKYFCA